MTTGNMELPDGFDEHSASWHFKKFVQFTKYKGQVGEPSPHLAIVGHMSRKKPVHDKAWMLGCYGATYCLPSAQAIWGEWSYLKVLRRPKKFELWLKNNWKGIVTRTERRCVRTYPKMFRCLYGYAKWVDEEFEALPGLRKRESLSKREYYDAVWKSVTSVPFMGRYISIRLVEGLRRYCGVEGALLYDVRSIGGWSPKKAMTFLYPEQANMLLTDSKEGNKVSDECAKDLLVSTRDHLPDVDYYIIAAMLCEYREAFERRHQYPGWTLDQEPLLYDKVALYWGKDFDGGELWKARAAIFPRAAVGEIGKRWYGTRWDCAKTLRDHGYNWTDVKYAFENTKDFSNPVRRSDG
jgi:hypothetical protein